MSLQTINTPRDTTFNTTESTPRNIADAIAEELHGIAQVLDPAASDYDALSNKPQVNGVTLSGNKTSKQLGIRQTIPLTSAQYAQLTSAEKMDVDKDYIITDENATTAPIDDSSVSRNSVWSSYKVDEELDTLNSALAEISDTEYAVTFNSNYFSSIQTKVVKIGKALHINAVLLCSTVPPADPSVIGAIVKGANLAPLSKNYAAIATAMRSTNDVYMYLKADGNLTVLSAYNFSASTWYTFDVIVDLA